MTASKRQCEDQYLGFSQLNYYSSLSPLSAIIACLVVSSTPALSGPNLTGCSNYVPAVGEVVTCNSSYAASTSGVQTPQSNTGNNNVTVNVDASSVRSINGSTIGIGSSSTVTNAGSLDTQSFYYGYGISFGANGRSTLGGNTVVNTATGRVTTGGSDSDAIYINSVAATSAANSITNDGILSTTGTSARGIRVLSKNSNATIQNAGTITTTGTDASGVYARNESSSKASQVNLTNTQSGKISVSGSNANAIWIDGTASIANAGMVCAGVVSGNSCTASANSTGSAISLINSNTRNVMRSSLLNNSTGTIASGGTAAAIITSSGGVDVFNYGIISSGGETAVDFADGAGLAANTLTVLGGSSIVGGIDFNGLGTGETLIFSGYEGGFGNAVTGANFIRAVDGSSAVMSAARYEFGSGTVDVDTSSSLQIDGVIADKAGTATSLDKVGSGILTLSANNTYSGATAVSAGTLLLTGAITSQTTIYADAILRGTGTVTGGVLNAGVIAPGTETSLGTLTVNGSYGSTGGVFLSRIGGSQSSPQADILRIVGADSITSGTTSVRVTDLGGLGGPTTGSGILLVDTANGAQTGVQSFALSDRVAAGAYEYNLVRGGQSGDSGQNWYLVTLDAPPPPPDPVPPPAPTPPPPSPQPPEPPAPPPTDVNTPPELLPDPPPPPAPPVVPSPPPPTPAPQPNSAAPNQSDVSYRVETANYTALRGLQRLYTYALVDTLQQRRGSGSIMTPNDPASDHGMWGRIGGNIGETNASGSDAMDMSYQLGFLQAGLDLLDTSDGHRGRILSGAFLALGTASTDTSTSADGHTGSASFAGYGGGIYATWLANSGVYVDALLQVTRFVDGTASSTGDQSISTDGWGGSGSFEAGWQMPLKTGLSLTPQGQVIVEDFSLDDAKDDYGAVTFGDGVAARGRLGLSLNALLGPEGTSTTELTLRASVWHVFAGEPETTFSTFDGSYPVDFSADIGTTWLAVDAGFTSAITEAASLTGTAGYEYGLDGSRHAFTGRVGFNVAW